MFGVVTTCRARALRYFANAATVVGWTGGNRDLANLVCPIVRSPRFQVYIGVTQMQCFGNAQARRGHQSEQGFVGGRTNAAGRPNPSCCRQQVNDLLIVEDVWGEASSLRAK